MQNQLGMRKKLRMSPLKRWRSISFLLLSLFLTNSSSANPAQVITVNPTELLDFLYKNVDKIELVEVETAQESDLHDQEMMQRLASLLKNSTSSFTVKHHQDHLSKTIPTQFEQLQKSLAEMTAAMRGHPKNLFSRIKSALKKIATTKVPFSEKELHSLSLSVFSGIVIFTSLHWDQYFSQNATVELWQALGSTLTYAIPHTVINWRESQIMEWFHKKFGSVEAGNTWLYNSMITFWLLDHCVYNAFVHQGDWFSFLLQMVAVAAANATVNMAEMPPAFITTQLIAMNDAILKKTGQNLNRDFHSFYNSTLAHGLDRLMGPWLKEGKYSEFALLSGVLVLSRIILLEPLAKELPLIDNPWVEDPQTPENYLNTRTWFARFKRRTGNFRRKTLRAGIRKVHKNMHSGYLKKAEQKGMVLKVSLSSSDSTADPLTPGRPTANQLGDTDQNPVPPKKQ